MPYEFFTLNDDIDFSKGLSESYCLHAGGDELNELTFHCFRLIFGRERKGIETLKPQLETGYVLGHKIEYDSNDFEFSSSGEIFGQVKLDVLILGEIQGN